MAMEEKWLLDNTNWMTWKLQVRHLLLAKGLWGYVDGSKALAVDANAQTREEVTAGIFNSCSGNQHPTTLITSHENPKDVWDALRKHYERDTLANKLFPKK